MKQLYYQVDKCLGCKSCEIACAVAHSLTGQLLKALKEEVLSLPRKKVITAREKNYPVSCRHCKDPKCVDACMARALVYDQEKGMVLHDETRCVGCWMCVMVCPFDAVRPGKFYTIKCDMCPDLDDWYACVEACPTGALFAATPEEFNKIAKEKEKFERKKESMLV